MAAQGIRNLYHVVFEGDGTKVKFYDNILNLRAESKINKMSEKK